MKQKDFPITTVGGLIFNENGHFLLIKTHKWNDKYGIPGGKIELGESCEEALIREIGEETNLSIFDIEFATVIDSVYNREFHKPMHMILLNYFCKTKDKHVILNEEAEAYRWVSLEESRTLPVNLATQKLLEVYERRYKKELMNEEERVAVYDIVG